MDHKAKFRSKKGQLPFVELNGEEIADSTFVIKQLSEKFNKDLDSGMYSLSWLVNIHLSTFFIYEFHLT